MSVASDVSASSDTRSVLSSLTTAKKMQREMWHLTQVMAVLAMVGVALALVEVRSVFGVCLKPADYD